MMISAREEVRRRMRESERLMSGLDIRDISADDNYTLPRPLKIGDKVFVTTISKEGEITALKDKKGLYSVTSGDRKSVV